jgi:hypothetical protein
VRHVSARTSVDTEGAMLRDHPHVQGLLLGWVLVLIVAVTAPFAVGTITNIGLTASADGPEEPVGKLATVSDPSLKVDVELASAPVAP